MPRVASSTLPWALLHGKTLAPTWAFRAVPLVQSPSIGAFTAFRSAPTDRLRPALARAAFRFCCAERYCSAPLFQPGAWVSWVRASRSET